MQIRVNRPINGLYPECQPEIGRIYEARSGPEPGRRQGIPFVIIDLPKKKNIVLREGEFEIVEEDTEKKVRGQWDKETAFAMLDRGMTVKEVAAELGVTVKQVEGAKYWRKRKEKEEKIKKLNEEMETEREEKTVGMECPWEENTGAEAIAAELDICRETVRRIRKNEYREDTIMAEEKQEARLPEATAAPADPEVLLRELSAARRRITRLEQVILAMTMERYA